MQVHAAALISENGKSQSWWSWSLGVVSRGGGPFQLSQPHPSFTPTFFSFPWGKIVTSPRSLAVLCPPHCQCHRTHRPETGLCSTRGKTALQGEAPEVRPPLGKDGVLGTQRQGPSWPGLSPASSGQGGVPGATCSPVQGQTAQAGKRPATWTVAGSWRDFVLAWGPGTVAAVTFFGRGKIQIPCHP